MTHPRPRTRSARDRRPALRPALLAALLAAPAALAAGPRELGMGGFTPPGAGAAAENPAFLAAGFEGAPPASLPLPLGLIGVLTDPSLDPRAEPFDLLRAAEAALRPGAWIWTPSTSPDEIRIRLEPGPDGPVLSVETEGGSRLRLAAGGRIGTGSAFELPLGGDLEIGGRSLRIGVRPYARARVTLDADEALRDLFGAGVDDAALHGRADAEAGVAVDVGAAFRLPLPAGEGLPRAWAGVRASPFVGLARLEAEATGRAGAVEGPDGEPDVVASYRGDAFIARPGAGLGFGVQADVGVAAAVPVDAGEVRFGAALRGVGIETWSGREVTFAGGDAAGGEAFASSGVPARRTVAADEVSLFVNAAFASDGERLGAPGLASLLVGVDAEVGAAGPSAHAGGEAGFDLPFGRLLARAGFGLDAGPVGGVGAGLDLPGVGVDVALHAFRAPFAERTALGVAAGLRFGF